MNKPSSLYIHIPFCTSICAYCDFPKLYYRTDWAESYLSALFFEAESKIKKGQTFDTIYIGGGTPSCLSDALFESLLSYFAPMLAPSGEFSMEANPESLTKEKASLMARFGVNRVSIGMQSSSKKLLGLMNRKHDFAMVEEAVERCKQNGIDNINVDLIYGLPEETDEQWKEDLEKAVSLDIPHISCYSLILEQSTMFAHKGIVEATQEVQAAQYEIALNYLREQGYERYEVSNFARNGKKCRHNLTYWKDEPYVALGLGASGYEGDVRYQNTLSLSSYLNHEFLAEQESVTKEDDLSYFFITNLRLQEGFEIARFNKRFGLDFILEYREEIRALENYGLLTMENGVARCTDKGILLLDTVLRMLMK